MTGVERIDQADALAVAHAYAKRLRTQYRAKGVIVFGSLTGETPWHSRSDIDLAAEGLAPELFWRPWADLDDLLPSGLSVDLVPLETAGPALRARIMGEVPMCLMPRLGGWYPFSWNGLRSACCWQQGRDMMATGFGLAGA
jgi:predicted nucleotidyltransferase